MTYKVNMSYNNIPKTFVDKKYEHGKNVKTDAIPLKITNGECFYIDMIS